MQCYINQYSNINVTSKSSQLNNGTRTVTENVADNNGISASYKAWKQFKNTEKQNNILPGVSLNEEQLFYWSFAHTWCGASRPNIYQNYTGVHSPNYARVIGSLQNDENFSNAYKCKSGSRMNPKNKCTLW